MLRFLISSRLFLDAFQSQFDVVVQLFMKAGDFREGHSDQFICAGRHSTIIEVEFILYDLNDAIDDLELQLGRISNGVRHLHVQFDKGCLGEVLDFIQQFHCLVEIRHKSRVVEHGAFKAMPVFGTQRFFQLCSWDDNITFQPVALLGNINVLWTSWKMSWN